MRTCYFRRVPGTQTGAGIDTLVFNDCPSANFLLDKKKGKEMLILQPPWLGYAEQVKALFGDDASIDIDYNDQKKALVLKVESARKANALGRLMPARVDFGGVSVDVSITPRSTAGDLLPDDATTADVLLAAFDGNPVVTQVRQVSKGLFRDLCYCVFRREVVQYPSDNLADINGNTSMLMQDIARKVLTKAEGVYFCTSAGYKLSDSDALDKPLGEWP